MNILFYGGEALAPSVGSIWSKRRLLLPTPRPVSPTAADPEVGAAVVPAHALEAPRDDRPSERDLLLVHEPRQRRLRSTARPWRESRRAAGSPSAASPRAGRRCPARCLARCTGRNGIQFSGTVVPRTYRIGAGESWIGAESTPVLSAASWPLMPRPVASGITSSTAHTMFAISSRTTARARSARSRACAPTVDGRRNCRL